jgi:IS5 family transposase
MFSEHEIGKELKAMSARLDQNRVILNWVARDLCLPDTADTGRQGLSAESV